MASADSATSPASRHPWLTPTLRGFAAATVVVTAAHVNSAPVANAGPGLKGRLLGDGLVPLDSALGRHRDAARCLAFAEGCQWVGHGMNHLDLLDRAEVYERLKDWLQ